MLGIIKKHLVFYLIILLLGLFSASKTYAASLSNVSDTITTSRPSAAAPLASNQAANDGQVTVIDLAGSGNNSALWIASDSAVLLPDTGQSLSTTTVASMSAANTPSSNQRIVYFTEQVSNTHHAGTTMITPVTATHTIRFTTISSVPSTGKIIITFPGSGSNIASPSATTFSFNNLTSSQIQANNATCGSYTISAPTITCNLSASINGAVTVTIIIGCTSQSGGTCTAFSPALINPIKTAAAAGTADTWTVGVKTQDGSAVDLDAANVKIGTIEAVQVQGTVEPYLTFTIAGVSNGSSICSDTTNPGTGLNSTSTFVNLGSLSGSQRNISAQTFTIDTNGASGYSLTATSSGRFINPASGSWLTDANGGNGLTGNDSTQGTVPNPAPIAAGTPAFGIHPCIGTGGTTTPTVPTGWGTGGGASNEFANPWNSGTNGYYALLASTTVPSQTSKTDIEYAATVNATTPPGIYRTVFTYVATATF